MKPHAYARNVMILTKFRYVDWF